ncbi:hypothetical protein LCGC14_1661270, partial [marine sediment metagenome]
FIPRVKPCGCYPINKANDIEVVRGESGRSFFTGLQHCKSVWTCPVCSLKISLERALEVQDICVNAFEEGLNASFVTLTIPHQIFDKCVDLKKTVSNSWRKVTNSRAYKDLKIKYKIRGYIRALEITKGSNGWHPHLHVLFLADASKGEIVAMSESIINQWLAVLGSGDRAASRAAQNLQLVYNSDGIEDYITKWDLSKELTEGHTKKTSRTPLMIFKEFQSTGDEDLLNDYKEFARAFHGARQLTFSRGLKEEFLKIGDMTDEEIVKDEKVDEVLFVLSPGLWKDIVRNNLEAAILNAYDEHGIKAAMKVTVRRYG